MDRPKLFLQTTILAFAALFLSVGAFAQSSPRTVDETQPGFEAVLHILVASNSTSAKGQVPASLSDTIRKLKGIYAFSDYRLLSTHFERVSSSIETKSVLRDPSDDQFGAYPLFTEWSIGGLTAPTDGRKGNLQMQVFRFNARVPVPMAAEGSPRPAVGFESIGMTAQRVSVPEGVPTVIGSLSMGRPGETAILVLTVTPVRE